MPKWIDDLIATLSIGDEVTVSWEDGKEVKSLFYAGVLSEGILGSKPVGREYLFVEDLSKIVSCRETCEYLKISYGFSIRNSGVKVASITPVKKTQ